MLFYFGSTAFFYFVYNTLDRYLPHCFPNSTEIVTRKYRIANSVKSAALMVLSFPGTRFLYYLTFYPHLNQYDTLNTIGAVYASTDLAALAYNPQCHTSTIVHHIVVQLFYYYCYYMDFNMNQGAARGIGIYCVLSSYAYLVNFRLSIRFLPFTRFEYYVNEGSLFIYTTTCMINWIVQSYLIFGGLDMMHTERLIYIMTLGMTVNDDLFLIKFLRKIDYKNIKDHVDTKDHAIPNDNTVQQPYLE